MRYAGSRTALLIALVCAGPPISAQSEQAAARSFERSVVGLEVAYQEWDQDRPWTKQEPKQRFISAVVVDALHLLTTADEVAHATSIQLQTRGRSRQIEPRLVRMDGSVNLALLELAPSPEVEGLQPVELAQQTPAAGVLRTVRWRRQQLESVSSRIVRFEVARSWGGRVEHAFMHMQTDLTGGGWAEPVFDDQRLVGITSSQSEQVSRAIPIEIVRAFLNGAPAGAEASVFPAFGVAWQLNRDPAVTAFLGQTGDPRGIIVRQVPWGSSGCGVLEPRDILLELGGHALDAEGYYQHPRLGRLKFNHILAEEYRVGDQVPLKILRKGKEREAQMTARAYPAELDLVPSIRVGQPPFVIAGGLVLRELDVPYLKTWGDNWSKVAPQRLLSRFNFEQEAQTPTRRRVVLITSVLPSAYNIGYHSLRDAVVDRVNGRELSELRDVVEALRSPTSGFHVLELSRDSGATSIVLDSASFDQATAEILEAYRIPVSAWIPPTPLPPGGGDCPGAL